jgi:hypothetical protein
MALIDSALLRKELIALLMETGRDSQLARRPKTPLLSPAPRGLGFSASGLETFLAKKLRARFGVQVLRSDLKGKQPTVGQLTGALIEAKLREQTRATVLAMLHENVPLRILGLDTEAGLGVFVAKFITPHFGVKIQARQVKPKTMGGLMEAVHRATRGKR